MIYNEKKEGKKMSKTKKTKSSSTSPRKRLYNPTTKSYYKVRERTTSRGQKGTIMSKWKSPRP